MSKLRRTSVAARQRLVFDFPIPAGFVRRVWGKAIRLDCWFNAFRSSHPLFINFLVYFCEAARSQYFHPLKFNKRKLLQDYHSLFPSRPLAAFVNDDVPFPLGQIPPQ